MIKSSKYGGGEWPPGDPQKAELDARAARAKEVQEITAAAVLPNNPGSTPGTANGLRVAAAVVDQSWEDLLERVTQERDDYKQAAGCEAAGLDRFKRERGELQQCVNEHDEHTAGLVAEIDALTKSLGLAHLKVDELRAELERVTSERDELRANVMNALGMPRAAWKDAYLVGCVAENTIRLKRISDVEQALDVAGLAIMRVRP